MTALEAEAERLASPGASRVRRFERVGATNTGFIVMHAPAGKEFCLD